MYVLYEAKPCVKGVLSLHSQVDCVNCVREQAAQAVTLIQQSRREVFNLSPELDAA